MNKVVYRNLGSNSGERMMYLRSTDVERKNWASLLMSFPDEALFHMTKGRKIVIEDKCNKKKGKIQRIFAPAFSDFIRFLQKKEPINKKVLQHRNFAIQAYKENKILKRKYHFFKDKITNINIIGRTIFVKKEPTVWL